MDLQNNTKQLMEFNKKLFDNTFEAIKSLHDQTEKNIDGFLEKAAWIPEEGKKAINEWVKACKKGREEFKTAADENYKKTLDYISNIGKEEAGKITKK
jgi:hypothetical protein